MTTGILAPAPLFQSFTGNGTPNAFGTLATYAAGTSTPQATYTDASLTQPNLNPIQLNPLGQAAVWLNPTLGYKFVWFDQFGNQIGSCDQVYGALTQAALTTILTQSYLGAILYPQTAAESSASITPSSYAYPTLPFADVRRYGCKCDGVTDDTAALQNALMVTATQGLALVLPYGYALKITSYVQVFSNTTFHILGQLQLTARASGLYANGATGIGIYGHKVGLIQDSTVAANYNYNPGATQNSAPSIHIRSCNHVTIEGLNFNYCSQGVFISNATQNYVTPGSGYTPTQAYPVDVKVRDCTMTFCEWSGISNLSSYDCGYYNNYVYRCGDGGLWMMGSINGEVVGNHRASPQTVYADVVTYGQNVQAHPTTWNDVQGMEFENCQNLLIANNIVEYIQGESIDIKQGCNRVLCTGNRVYNAEQYGIVVRQGDAGDVNACFKVTISDNTISSHGYIMFSNAPGGVAAAISASSDFNTVIKDNTIFSYQLTPGIQCVGPGTYLSSQYGANQQQAALTVTGNVVEFMGSNPYDMTEFQFTSTTLSAILITGAYTSVKCDGNHIRTDRYYFSDARINASPAIKLVYAQPSAGLYYPTSASISNNIISGWGFTGIEADAYSAMTYSGLTISGNNIAGVGGYGINVGQANYAVVTGNNVSQLNNSTNNSYVGINLAGSSGTPMVGTVCSGNSITGAWNIGGNNMPYCIQLIYMGDLNITNNKMAGYLTGAVNLNTISGNLNFTGSTGYPRSLAGTPNGALTSYWQGEMVFDTTGLHWWAASSYQSTVWTQLSN